MWWAIEYKDKNKESIKDLIKIRKYTEHFTPGIISVFKKSLKDIYPEKKKYSGVLLLSEIEKNILPKDSILNKRLKYYAYTNSKLFDSNEEIFDKYNIQLIDKSSKTNFLKGQTAYPGNVKGKVRIIERREEIKNFKKGEILVASTTTPDFLPAMKLASGIISENGGAISHAAITSRELKIPCIVGVKGATKLLKNEDLVEVDADKGIVKILEKQNAKSLWIKEGEIPLGDNKNLFLLNDILLYPITSRVEKRTGISEGVISYIDREEKINKVYTSQDNKRGEWGYEFFLNTDKFNKFLNEVKEVYKKSKKFRDKLDKLALEKISLPDLKEIFTKDIKNLWQSKVLVYFTIDPYSWKIEKNLKDDLSKILPKEEFENVLGTLVLQEERDSLENERYSWLKEVILPVLEKEINPQGVKKDKHLINKVEEHFNYYKSYSAGFGMEMWSMDYYLKLVNEDLKKNKKELRDEYLSLKNKAEINKIKKQKIIKKFNIPSDLVKKAYVLGKLANLRLDLRVMSWSYYVYILITLLNLCSKKAKLSELEINSLTYDEFIDLLDNNFEVSGELKKNINQRKNTNLLQISTPEKGFEVLLGVEAKNRFYSEVGHETKLENPQSFKGDVACRKGIVRGKVFTFRYGSPDFVERISKFPKGAILIANLTMPVLMPAIRKASAMVTDGGGITCHAAIVSREFGIPCVIGTGIATKILKDGDEIEVDTNTGIVKLIKKSN